VTRQPLTARQADVLRFIVMFMQERWRQPGLREISLHFGFNGNPSAAQQHIAALCRKGWLVRERKGVHSHGVIPGCTLRIDGLDELLEAVPVAHRGCERMAASL
jgi:SOS-response transcriptional repressor LexA